MQNMPKYPKCSYILPFSHNTSEYEKWVDGKEKTVALKDLFDLKNRYRELGNVYKESKNIIYS